MEGYIISFINIAFRVYIWLIIIRIILSWIQVPYNPVVKFIYELTEPVLGVFRRLVPSIGMLDISPIVAVLALDVLKVIIINILYRIL